MKSEERERGDSIVIELQRAASNSSIRTSDLLRKALLVAMKLKIIDQEPWIQSELNGYSNADPNPFPPYRLLDGEVQQDKSYAAVYGCSPYSNSISRSSYGYFKRQACNISITDIEVLLNDYTDDNEVDIPCTCPPFVKKVTETPGPLVLTVQASRARCIVEAVRTRIFNWALTLEEKGVSGENLQFSDEPMKSERADIVVASPAQTGAGEPPKPSKQRSPVTEKEAADICDCTSRTIRNWEAGIHTPKNPPWPGLHSVTAIKAFAVTRKSDRQSKQAIRNMTHGDMDKLPNRAVSR